MAKLQFLGATRTVTGSKFYLETDRLKVLIDCGLFQGLKELRLLNWSDFPINPRSLDYIILTHAHIDHCGYIPRLVKLGFSGKIIATPPTCDLVKILLPDSAQLQEEEAAYANKYGFSKHKPALPLYTLSDAQKALKLLTPLRYNKIKSLDNNFTICYNDAGHILGSAILEIWLKDKNGEKTKFTFSGDLGKKNSIILNDPTKIKKSDYVIMETTYADRQRTDESGKDILLKLIEEIKIKKSALVIPAFAVERSQELLYTLRGLSETIKLPPVFIDSPMAIEVTRVFEEYTEDYDLDAKEIYGEEGGIFYFDNLYLCAGTKESKKLNRLNGPLIIISSSGMVSGGRILHHLKMRLPDPNNIVFLAGYQALGTRGRLLQEGAPKIKIHGQYIPVNAKIVHTNTFSAHADCNELFDWVTGFKRKPKNLFLVHGEYEGQKVFKEKVEKELQWNVTIPEFNEIFEL